MQLIQSKGVPKERTFAALGVTSANFRSRAKSTPVNSDVLEKLYAMFPDLNLHWLLTGDGPMLTTPSPIETSILDRNEQFIRENERLRIELDTLRATRKKSGTSEKTPE